MSRGWRYTKSSILAKALLRVARVLYIVFDYSGIYIYACIVIPYSKSMDQPFKVANPARGQLNRKMNISLSPFGPENLVSRDGFDRPVPR